MDTLAWKPRHSFLHGINYYVPQCTGLAGMAPGMIMPVSLGIPAALDDDIVDTDIDGDGTAGTVTAQNWTADSPYGRTLSMTASGDPGATGGTYDVYGTDYLGQRVRERFSGLNGSTARIDGKKAFYTVDSVINVTACTNAVTWKLGTGYRLGLPFKGDVLWAKEAGVLVPVYNRNVEIWKTLADADATAGTSIFIRAPFPGYVNQLMGVPHGGGSTTDPVVTVELGGTAITGLTVTVDTSNAAGLTVTDTPTTAGYSANNRFRTGGLIELVSAAAASAGSIDVGVLLTPTQCLQPDTTDPQTTTTGDPRGTYESLMTMDATSEVIIGLLPDPSVNSSGNGGLYGIKHVT